MPAATEFPSGQGAQNENFSEEVPEPLVIHPHVDGIQEAAPSATWYRKDIPPSLCKEDKLRLALTRQCTLIAPAATIEAPLPPGMARLSMVLEMDEGGTTVCRSLYSTRFLIAHPTRNGQHVLIEAFKRLPAIHQGPSSRTESCHWLVNEPLPDYLEKELDEELPIDEDTTRSPFSLADFSSIRSVSNRDLALRYHGASLVKEALDRGVAISVGMSEHSGEQRWIRDIGGLRKLVGPGCPWNLPRIMSHVQLLECKYRDVAVQRHPKPGDNLMAGIGTLEAAVYAYFARDGNLAVVGDVKLMKAGAALEQVYGQDWSSMRLEPLGDKPVYQLLIWLECQIRGAKGLSVRDDLTEAHLVAREEEYELRIEQLWQAGGSLEEAP